ncbi:MAG: ABC transporter permease [Lachnospiraceae bacterium]|nr:ABC transporter permease [Lachnospiraceae bacterium]
MGKYVIKRLLWLIVVAVCTALVIFTIMYFIPGDPATIALPSTATYAEKEAFRDSLGLNDPFIVQLGSYLYQTFIKFDFGTSWEYNTPVVQELFARFPRTFLLSMINIILAAAIGIPLGIMCALRQNKWQDHTLMVVSMIGVSIPEFWLALMLILLFTARLGWLPAFGIGSPAHWVMPVIAGSFAGIAKNARQTRSSTLETIRSDFVTTARAKGLPERLVIYKHMLPNALIPIINILGAQLTKSIGGTVVIESVFTFPGVGLYMLSGINNRDYPVVRSCVLVLSLFAAVITLLVDLIYAFVDPRIKAQYVVSGKKGGKKK